jgi:nitrogen fixation NifU-like protein
MPGFSDVVIEHFRHPRGTGALPDPSGEGWSGSLEESRYMRIQVRLKGDCITDARFATYGCAPAIAAGSVVCEWVLGKTPDQATALTADTLTAWLGGLPPGREFCAHLAIEALAAALQAAGSKRHGEVHDGR